MLILGIETSCDETGLALVEDGINIIADAVASQEQIHAPYAGVVPELASRQHMRLLAPMTSGIMRDAGLCLGQIGLVAVTRGPGLAGCLIAGLCYAKGLAYGLGVPVMGINHIEAHIWSCTFGGEVEYPALALVVSGGHTLLVLIRRWGSCEVIGQTRDDAVGEAYDKVASLLGLPFPGGPEIEARAAECNSYSGAVRFPRPLIRNCEMDFSFSGLKTAVLYWLKRRGGGRLSGDEVREVARGFQDAVVEVLVSKTAAAARRTRARCMLLAGGVARNEALRTAMGNAALRLGIGLVCAPKEYCTDNGVMVASLAARKYADGDRGDFSMDIAPGLRLC